MNIKHFDNGKVSKSLELRKSVLEALYVFIEEGYALDEAIEKLTGKPVPKGLEPITIVEAEALLVIEAKRQYNGMGL